LNFLSSKPLPAQHKSSNISIELKHQQHLARSRSGFELPVVLGCCPKAIERGGCDFSCEKAQIWRAQSHSRSLRKALDSRIHTIYIRRVPHARLSTTRQTPPCLNQYDRVQPVEFPIVPNMCYIVYTIHVCNHWIPQPQPNNGPILRICDEAEKLRLGHPCPETHREHKVMNRSQGMCTGCMWKKVSM
jgi:hypothetical protein